MKVSIELSDVEVKGIKAYLSEDGEKATAEAVKIFIRNIVSGVIHSPDESVSDYIQKQAS